MLTYASYDACNNDGVDWKTTFEIGHRDQKQAMKLPKTLRLLFQLWCNKILFLNVDAFSQWMLHSRRPEIKSLK